MLQEDNRAINLEERGEQRLGAERTERERKTEVELVRERNWGWK